MSHVVEFSHCKALYIGWSLAVLPVWVLLISVVILMDNLASARRTTGRRSILSNGMKREMLEHFAGTEGRGCWDLLTPQGCDYRGRCFQRCCGETRPGACGKASARGFPRTLFCIRPKIAPIPRIQKTSLFQLPLQVCHPPIAELVSRSIGVAFEDGDTTEFHAPGGTPCAVFSHLRR
jgi:hypothetical protein